MPEPGEWRRVDADLRDRGGLRPAVWGDTLSGRSIDAETSRWLLASAMFVFAACQGAATPSPSRRRPQRRRPPVGGTGHRRRPRATRGGDRPARTRRTSPRTGHGRRFDLIIGDWQEANAVQPVLPRARSPRRTWRRRPGRRWWSSPTTTSTRRTSRPSIPTLDNGGVKVPGDNGDAMTVTWTLRAGLKWSDGQPLTCDDFKYAAGLGPGQGQRRRRRRSGFEDITNVRVHRPTPRWSCTSRRSTRATSR